MPFVNDTRADCLRTAWSIGCWPRPHYGERWGRHWLDLARYADSNGYTIDAPRSIWKYRDWVIDALNRDMPFDQFTHRAAGRRPAAQRRRMEQKIATGFHRNTQINQEGGIDLEQFRVESIVDRVNTTGTVWLGLTVGCCQCHDHKFDPIAPARVLPALRLLQQRRRAEPGSCRRRSKSKQRQAIRRPDRRRWRKQLTTARLRQPRSSGHWEGKLSAADRATLPDEIQNILAIAAQRPKPQAEADPASGLSPSVDQTRHVVGGLGDPLPFAGAGSCPVAA